MNLSDNENLAPDRNAPIGVFDSGMGGITVLKSLMKELPFEDFIYFGDSANAPYGEKTPEQIRAYSADIVNKLMDLKVKAIVIACNTATSAAASFLRKSYPDFPIIGIEPALKPAVTAHPHGKIIVMATPATLALPKFSDLLNQFMDQAQIHLLPIHGLVELIEKGIVDGPEVDDILKMNFEKAGCLNPDAVVLGCTHFPLVSNAIRNIAGPDADLIDGGEGTARHLKDVLTQKHMLSASNHKGRVTFLNSLNDPQILRQMNAMLHL